MATPLAAFKGKVAGVRTRPLYVAGLAMVACAMVLLPPAYPRLIGVVVSGIVLHLLTNTWIVAHSGGGWVPFVSFVGTGGWEGSWSSTCSSRSSCSGLFLHS
jgi:hypothetical protein